MNRQINEHTNNQINKLTNPTTKRYQNIKETDYREFS